MNLLVFLQVVLAIVMGFLMRICELHLSIAQLGAFCLLLVRMHPVRQSDTHFLERVPKREVPLLWRMERILQVGLFDD
jgi:carbon starvation protein CstA